MKLKRFAALALALAVALTLVTAPASAALFSDLENHWSRDDVETVAARGLVKGYTDGTFKPDNRMAYCEALLFCSRATGISATDKSAIAYNRAEELQELSQFEAANQFKSSVSSLSTQEETGEQDQGAAAFASGVSALSDEGDVPQSAGGAGAFTASVEATSGQETGAAPTGDGAASSSGQGREGGGAEQGGGASGGQDMEP